ncbi:hypothetical protein BDK51DRAFT_38593 [Blyttiomyces helicus]|uniref:Uncharacterized protein n=1 Tax=Blyttiomyces helicus TaxID=388810 RepID=A0A4P9W940_9FUNG|nr:hypothetical protein BDK51DRAFT_38593 [Blyttiomyces helicus]|eukprot:RKO88005.1 hypothetical protein BDK51DRAFT_38593 [Blyttiomyces helicus]
MDSPPVDPAPPPPRPTSPPPPTQGLRNLTARRIKRRTRLSMATFSCPPDSDCEGPLQHDETEASSKTRSMVLVGSLFATSTSRHPFFPTDHADIITTPDRAPIPTPTVPPFQLSAPSSPQLAVQDAGSPDISFLALPSPTSSPTRCGSPAVSDSALGSDAPSTPRAPAGDESESFDPEMLDERSAVARSAPLLPAFEERIASPLPDRAPSTEPVVVKHTTEEDKTPPAPTDTVVPTSAPSDTVTPTSTSRYSAFEFPPPVADAPSTRHTRRPSTVRLSTTALAATGVTGEEAILSTVLQGQLSPDVAAALLDDEAAEVVPVFSAVALYNLDPDPAAPEMVALKAGDRLVVFGTRNVRDSVVPFRAWDCVAEVEVAEGWCQVDGTLFWGEWGDVS